MSNDNGGPAFPRPVSAESITDTFAPEQDGMTLRDYFAAHAPAQCTEFCADTAAALVGRPMPEWKAYMDDGKKESEIAYQIDKAKFRIELQVVLRGMYADAMLEARQK